MDSILATTTGLTHNEDLSEYESQLDLFNKVGTDTNIISSRYMELEPQSVVTDESKQFIFNSSSQDTPETKLLPIGGHSRGNKSSSMTI